MCSVVDLLTILVVSKLPIHILVLGSDPNPASIFLTQLLNLGPKQSLGAISNMIWVYAEIVATGREGGDSRVRKIFPTIPRQHVVQSIRGYACE